MVSIRTVGANITGTAANSAVGGDMDDKIVV